MIEKHNKLNSLIESKAKTWIPTFTIGLGFFFVFVCFLYYWFPRIAVGIYKAINWSDVSNSEEKTGPIGDTIGGTLGPLIALIGAIITGLAFLVQYLANQQQKRDIQLERFENRFYSLVEIHRNNVNEITIGKSTYGRKAFISMFNELKFTYFAVEDCYQKIHVNSDSKDKLSSEERFNIAYLIFFFGIGPNSSMIVKDLIGIDHEAFFSEVEKSLKTYQGSWKVLQKENAPISVGFNNQNIFELDIRYKPFNGHASKLSHYIRNLFQLVKFIDDGNPDLLTPEDKYNYASTIRSQLSVHEQLLLFYNAISILGKPWIIERELLKRYCMVKSAPITIANFYKTPQDVLGLENMEGKPMFEWIEIRERMKDLRKKS